MLTTQSLVHTQHPRIQSPIQTSYSQTTKRTQPGQYPTFTRVGTHPQQLGFSTARCLTLSVLVSVVFDRYLQITRVLRQRRADHNAPHVEVFGQVSNPAVEEKDAVQQRTGARADFG